MSKISRAALVAAALFAVPAFAGNGNSGVNTIVSFDGLGDTGYAGINPGYLAPDGSGVITLEPGVGAGQDGLVTFHLVHPSNMGDAPPNCVYGPAQQFETTTPWPFPSQFNQYGKDAATGNVTLEWRTGAPLTPGATYLIARVCAAKSKN